MTSRLKKLFSPVAIATGLQKSTDELLEPIGIDYRNALLSMYRGEPQKDLEGQLHEIDKTTVIAPKQLVWLYETYVEQKPKTSLEVGMAFGYSTIACLAAIAENNAGHHTAIDPFQRTRWDSIGLAHATTLAPKFDNGREVFRYMEDRSDRAATDLLREGRSFDLIFIDGNHRFDDVLVDFYLYAQLCNVGGRIIFDDMWMSSVQTVADFVRTNRVDFQEIPTNVSNVCVFEKRAEDVRPWNEFRQFTVSKSSP